MSFKGFLGVLKSYWFPILLVCFVAVVFVSAPFIALWRMAKRVPVAGKLLDKVPGAAS